MAAKKKPREVLTRAGVSTRVEARTGTTAVVLHVGLQQWEFEATQARLLARQLRLAAALIDPDPVEV